MSPALRSYLIVPCVLLAVFLFFEREFRKKREIRDNEHAAQLAAEKAAEDAHRATLRTQTLEASRLRAEERDRQDRERAEKKRSDQERLLQKINGEADAHAIEAGILAKEALALEQKLSALRKEREVTSREAFALSQQVERQRIDRRSAEFEIQRTTKMVAARLLESRWANPP